MEPLLFIVLSINFTGIFNLSSIFSDKLTNLDLGLLAQ